MPLHYEGSWCRLRMIGLATTCGTGNVYLHACAGPIRLEAISQYDRLAPALWIFGPFYYNIKNLMINSGVKSANSRVWETLS